MVWSVDYRGGDKRYSNHRLPEGYCGGRTVNGFRQHWFRGYSHDSPVREDGSEKWVDYAYSFWHVDCVRGIGLKAFTERYQAFCKRHHYIFQADKPEKLFNASKRAGSCLFPRRKPISC